MFKLALEESTSIEENEHKNVLGTCGCMIQCSFQTIHIKKKRLEGRENHNDINQIPIEKIRIG